METSPAVFGRSLEHGQKKQAEIIRLIADRMGVDPARDLRPHVAAAAANGAALDVWMGGDAPAEHVSDLMDQVFAILEDGVNYPSKPAGA